jgi:hypothetical protein
VLCGARPPSRRERRCRLKEPSTRAASFQNKVSNAAAGGFAASAYVWCLLLLHLPFRLRPAFSARRHDALYNACKSFRSRASNSPEVCCSVSRVSERPAQHLLTRLSCRVARREALSVLAALQVTTWPGQRACITIALSHPLLTRRTLLRCRCAGDRV